MARKEGKDRGLFQRPAKSGIWWICYFDEFGHKHRQKAGTKTAAKDMYKQRQREKLQGTLKPPRDLRRPKLLLADYVKRYLVDSKARKRSYRSDRRSAEAWVAYLGKNCTMAEVKPENIEAWMAEQSERLAPATVVRDLAVLSSIFSRALRDGEVERNPVALVKRPKFSNRRERYLGHDAEDILRQVYPTGRWHGAELALYTGLRQEEQLTLRWEAINFETGIISVPRSKHGEARDVQLNDDLLLALRQQYEALPAPKSPWVYPGRDGLKHASQRVLVHHFDLALEKAVAKGCRSLLRDAKRDFHPEENPIDFTWHDLRHSFASRLVMAGVDIVTVKELLGHKTLAMTLRYSHVQNGHKRDAVNKILRPRTDTRTDTAESLKT